MNLQPLQKEETEAFLEQMLAYYKELDARFKPDPTWRDDLGTALFSGEKALGFWLVENSVKVGFAVLGFEEHVLRRRKLGLIREFYLAPKHRRRGLGQAFAALICQYLQQSGATKIHAEVVIGNEPASKLWQKAGFHAYATRWVHP